MNDLEKHLEELSNMDEETIVFAAFSLKKHRHINLGHHEQIRDTINKRLQVFGYELRRGCCGNFMAVKITQE